MFVQKLPFATLEWRSRQPILVRWIGFNPLPTAGSMSIGMRYFNTLPPAAKSGVMQPPR